MIEMASLVPLDLFACDVDQEFKLFLRGDDGNSKPLRPTYFVIHCFNKGTVLSCQSGETRISVNCLYSA
jgi:hypothetical protein